MTDTRRCTRTRLVGAVIGREGRTAVFEPDRGSCSSGASRVGGHCDFPGTPRCFPCLY